MSRVCSLAAEHVVHAQAHCRGVLLSGATPAGLPAVATHVAHCSSVDLRIQVSRHIACNTEHGSVRARHFCEHSQVTA